MNRALLCLAMALAAAPCRGAGEGAVLTPGNLGPRWGALVDALSKKGPIRASFTESRHFAFRKAPTVLKGVLRISAERGLSLQYTDPEPSILIADQKGLVMRGPDGRSHELPAGTGAAGAIESILPIMRFDMRALFPAFMVRAEDEAAGWRFEFTPRDRDTADAFGSVVVRGSGTDVTHIEFRRSGSQRVDIDVGETRAGVAFSPEELSMYFR